MKRFSIKTVIMMIAALGSSAPIVQADQLHSDLVIVKYDWFQSFPIFSAGSPFQPANENFVQVYERYGSCVPHLVDVRKPDAFEQGLAPTERQARKEVEEFVYRLRVRNFGPKAIKGIWWDYVSFDPETNKELARRSFYNETRLLPNRTKTVIAVSAKPATSVITVGMLYPSATETYSEHVEIRGVKYSDGSVWTTP